MQSVQKITYWKDLKAMGYSDYVVEKRSMGVKKKF
jgi:hypothetical protein